MESPGDRRTTGVYDRLCHFYWLIDQKVGPDSKIVENNEWFSNFLFGGSDIIVLFQEGTNPHIYTGKQYRHYGTTIATCDKR